MLTQERLKELLNYDPDTGVFTWVVQLSLRAPAGAIAGWTHETSRRKKYSSIAVLGKTYLAHRLVFLYMEGELPDKYVDHIDGNGQNNSWNNLRHATKQDNARNCRLMSNNKTGFNGVHFIKSRQAYVAEIRVNGANKYLGIFKEKQDAIRCREEANIKYGYHENHGSDRPL